MNDVLKGAMRGVIASMAMSGMRVVTTSLGLVQQAPPDQMAGKTARREGPAFVELAHWAFGAAGAAVYGALPDAVRRQAWTGPAYGIVVWMGFQAAAPVLGLPHAKDPKVLERIATAADHALYGYVLSETKRVPTY